MQSNERTVSTKTSDVTRGRSVLQHCGNRRIRLDFYMLLFYSKQSLISLRDRMPIHHKALDKRRIPRKNKPLKGDEYITRSKTFATFKRGTSKADLNPEPVRPTTPKYLKENFDYDKSSSGEETESVSDDGKYNADSR